MNLAMNPPVDHPHGDWGMNVKYHRVSFGDALGEAYKRFKIAPK